MKAKEIVLAYSEGLWIDCLDGFPGIKTYRIELWDDEIDTIRTFDVESQRSIENVTSMRIYPACEIVLDETTMQKGIKKIDKELNSYVSTLRGEMKNEEASRITGIINEFKERNTRPMSSGKANVSWLQNR